MEERELAIWKGIRDALCEPIQNKRLWKPECETCSRYDLKGEIPKEWGEEEYYEEVLRRFNKVKEEE